MKIRILAVLALTLAASSVSAQSIQLGPGGVQIDPRGNRERQLDERRERANEDRREQRQDQRREQRQDERREDRMDRRRANEDTRGQRCRMVTVREEDDDGTVTRRQVRRCN